MSQLSKIPPLESNQQLTKLSPSVILKEQPEGEALAHLCSLIQRLVKLYQIQGFDNDTVAILADWILDNYKYETLDMVTKVLTNPPKTSKPSWRLTPDTINEWMAIELERQAEERERQAHNGKQEAPIENQWTEERLKKWEEVIGIPGKRVPSISEQEIKEEGQERPKSSYTPPDREYFILLEMKSRYGIECCDKYTGQVLPGMPSFDEWLKLNR